MKFCILDVFFLPFHVVRSLIKIKQDISDKLKAINISAHCIISSSYLSSNIIQLAHKLSSDFEVYEISDLRQLTRQICYS